MENHNCCECVEKERLNVNNALRDLGVANLEKLALQTSADLKIKSMQEQVNDLSKALGVIQNSPGGGPGKRIAYQALQKWVRG